MSNFAMAMSLVTLFPVLAIGVAALVLGMPLAVLWVVLVGGSSAWLYLPPLAAWVLLWAEVGVYGLLRSERIWSGLGWCYLTGGVAVVPVAIVAVNYGWI
jgi:hypothetical protein